ncbi:epoxide hydrolase 4-like [Bacillus rossius redtenbacheri]|uniref:epoxide hydrolase 4-like n=1 Tax=Bacillus rossius redtenbacheri TaxID=93214 RepID=UPI002FDC9399
MFASDEQCIVNISPWETLQIHAFSFLCGLWVVVKSAAKWGWKSKNSGHQQKRDTPPPCLVDTSLGSHLYVKLKGVKLHYVESGDRTSPVVLLLHGFPDCWLSWRHQIPVLADHFRVVALDLKGFGDSDKPAWRSSYRVDTLLEELKDFIGALGVNRCTVIGHDLGGLLGWYLVHRYPELVEKFVAISSPHPNVYWGSLPCAGTFNKRWVQFSQLPYLPEMDALKEDLSIINQCFNHLHKTGKTESYVEAYKYAFSRKEDWTGPINYFRNLPFKRVHTDGEPTLAPCLLIVGNRDEFVSLESMVKSTDYTCKFLLKIVDGGSHFPHQELPDVVDKMLLAFLVAPPIPAQRREKSPSKSLVNRMFGAVSSTVKYGNQVLDSVQRRTSVVVPLALQLGQAQS